MDLNKKWTVEIFDPENNDPNELLALFSDEYGEVDPARYDYFNWFCLENPVGKAIIHVARELKSGKIIGQNWLVPMRILVDGVEYISTMWAGAIVHPDYRRLGVYSSIISHFSDEFKHQIIDFIVGIPNDTTIKVAKSRQIPEIGIHDLMLRPLDWSFLEETNFGKYPYIIKPIILITNLLSQILIRPKKLVGFGPGYRIERTLPYGEAYDDFWTRVKGKYAIMFARDFDFIEWRFKNHPTRSYETYVAWRENEIVGYIVFRSTKFRGFPAGFIVDFLVEPSERGEEAGKYLISVVENHLANQNTKVIITMSRPLFHEGQLLRSQGFFRIPKRFQSLPLLLNRIDRTENLPTTLLDTFDNWFMQFGDLDYI